MTTPASLCRDPLHLLSLGFGSGLFPKAPGTAGSVVALLIYYLFMDQLAPVVYLPLVLAVTLLGFYLCGRTARALGVHDHPGIVWDEFAGLWLALFALPPGWYWPLLGFALFRVFDIFKPWPISWLDRHVHGGLGIMLDDILAGTFAGVCLQLIIVFL
jgi:phosphatidylglycerophosphatase A